MAIKTIDQNPKITDTISFEILTPGSDNCFTANPYKVDKVTIYYLERDFISSNLGIYDKNIYDDNILKELNDAQKLACSDPSEQNLNNLENVRAKLQNTSKVYTSYYKEASPIKVIGTADYPAWLSSDVANAFITNVPLDDDGNVQYGHFNYLWNPSGRIREGEYVICWTWSPLVDGGTITQHQSFFISGDPQSVSANPTHITPKDKYLTLLERYLPEMYKIRLGNSDLTPQSLFKLNQSIASGFTVVEDLANQLIDLLDANTISEYLLVHLANLFNLKLRSDDPTLWRRQIKQAVPLFKKKGTYNGLKEALAQAAIELTKVDRLWQVSPKYTHTFSIKVTNDVSLNDNLNIYFPLPTSIIFPATYSQNLQVWLRTGDTYDIQSNAVVNFYEGDDGIWYVEWLGDSLSIPINLNDGDVLLIKYEKMVVPSIGEQSIEDYILSLPLMDSRDEIDQQYPLKNWNTRLITEDDPMYDTLISVRHPFEDDVIFGQVRTEFPYSENVYNMEEYNGSTRDSTNPCDIDKDFLDACQQCISSKFDIYVNIENLSDQRAKEVGEIIDEFIPFHAQINSINYSGELNDFILPPQEEIDFLISNQVNEYIVPYYATPLFNRVMGDEINGDFFLRSELANFDIIAYNYPGIGFNDRVVLFTPNVIMNDLGVDESNNVLEILSPSPNAGFFSINNVNQNYADVSVDVIEPLNQEMFTYNLYNIIFNTSIASIVQDDLFKLKLTDDNIVDYFDEIKTQWDVVNNPNYTGDGWKILISAYSPDPYDILDFNPNTGELIILDPDRTLPVEDTNNITAEILDDSLSVVVTDTQSKLIVTRRGRLNLNDSNFTSFENSGFIRLLDQVIYLGVSYKVLGFTSDNEIYISGYDVGDAGSVNLEIRRQLISNAAGYFGYQGLKINTTIDLETDLGVVNGANNLVNSSNWTESSLFKEILLITIGNNYYKITEIDGNEITISGINQDWQTYNAGGTPINYSIIQYTKTPQTLNGEDFSQINRSGNELIDQEIEYVTTFMSLKTDSGSGVQERVSTEDFVQIVIEYDDGRIEERKL